MLRMLKQASKQVYASNPEKFKEGFKHRYNDNAVHALHAMIDDLSKLVRLFHQFDIHGCTYQMLACFC